MAVALAASAGAREDLTGVKATGVGTLVLHIPPAATSDGEVKLPLVADDQGLVRFSLHPQEGTRVELKDGAPTGVRGGFRVQGLRLRSQDGRRTPPFELIPRQGLDFEFRDRRGRVWLQIDHAMRSPDLANDHFRLLTADLRVGPALAAWAPRLRAGDLFAGAALSVPLALADGSRLESGIGKSCAAPNWPGTPGFITDVSLTRIDAIDILPNRCRRVGGAAGACDGPGGVEGELAIVPSTTLRNSSALNASEVPWYTRLSGAFPPYGNDQHPFLTWNLYRVDGDGRLLQLARSGLKHAFATANDNCAEPCGNSHILGRGCEDPYNAGSNDFAPILSQRREVIPARGLWARCGSEFDGNCDGRLDSLPADDGYRHRLLVRESAIEVNQHPEALWWMEAGYIVRDDQDIRNTMGSRGFTANYLFSWRATAADDFVPGPVTERWVRATPIGARGQFANIVSDEGEASVAVRVVRQSDGRFRYDYAVMNLSFSRPTTSGSEPALRVLDNRGFDAFSLDLRGTSGIEGTSFADADAEASNDWTPAIGAKQIQWTAPSAGATLDWGSLHSFRLLSPSPPMQGSVRLHVAAAGATVELAESILVPDGERVFVDGFDDPG